MLVGHDAVDSLFVSQHVLFVVLVVQGVGLLRVEIGVGKIQPPGIVPADVLFLDEGVGLLGVEVDVNMFLL